MCLLCSSVRLLDKEDSETLCGEGDDSRWKGPPTNQGHPRQTRSKPFLGQGSELVGLCDAGWPHPNCHRQKPCQHTAFRASMQTSACAAGGSDPGVHQAAPQQSPSPGVSRPILVLKVDGKLPNPERWEMTTPASTGQKNLHVPQWPFPSLEPREALPVSI